MFGHRYGPLRFMPGTNGVLFSGMNAQTNRTAWHRLGATEPLASAAALARERYRKDNPTSLKIFNDALQALPGANTRTVLHYSPFPVAIARAQGAQIEDADGHDYQDFLGEYTAGLYGHRHPVIINAISQALERGLTLGGPGLKESRLARLMCDRFKALERLRFCNSGTEANVLALSSARAFSGRSDILVVDGSYHGGVLSYAGQSPLNLPFPTHRIRFNDADTAVQKITELDVQLAAIIVEPMIGAGGCIPAQPEFLQALRTASEKTGALLIFDEVMTSRLGASGLHGRLDICPDLVTFGKYLGGGLSFGAFGGRADILDRFDPRLPDAWPHAGTFNNNTLSMSAGFAGLNDVFTAEVSEAFFEYGENFRKRLSASLRALQLPLHLTGMGSMMAIHFCDQSPTAPYPGNSVPPDLYELVHLKMMAAGQFYARRGMINLSLPMTESMLGRFEEALIATLGECADHIEQSVTD